MRDRIDVEGRSVVVVELGVVAGGSLRVPMSRAEFDGLNEAKHHEFYDGMCVVNPPVRRHVVIAVRLLHLLEACCPAGCMVYPEWGWRTPNGDFQPDLMIAPVDAPQDVLREPPLLVVEVLSPSTRDADLGRKRELYAAAGAPWYWVVDPDGPDLRIFRADGGALVAAQRIRQPATTVGPVSTLVDPRTLCA